MARRSSAGKKKDISIDTKAGSRSYNRLDMQVSQVLHMAIELYPNLNYLFILDHYDDITLFDDENTLNAVSYYQMKTSEDSISVDTAISEAWFAKLYEQLKEPQWLVKEIGLITNCPLRITVITMGANGKRTKAEKAYSAERTPISSFKAQVIEKIKADIAKRNDSNIEDVDLSKFVHMRTTLSIPKHKEIVEQEMNDFLQKQYPRITIESAKTIFRTMMDILTRCQGYELLDKDAPFEQVREKKGMSKTDFSRVIDNAMLIAIPDFQEIEKYLSLDQNEKYAASYEYTKIITDLKSKSDSFTAVFMRTRNLCADHPKENNESVQDYCERINKLMSNQSLIYNSTYISVLVACIQINEWRRSQ